MDIEAKSARLDFDFSVYEVAGRATLGDGSPVTGVRLSLRRVDDQLPFGTPATTNGDGAFRVRLPPGEYGAGVLLDGHWTTSRDTFRVRGHRSGVRVRFGHRLTISGAVHGLGEGEAARLQIEAVSDRLDIRSASTPRGSPTEFSISGLGAGVWTVIARIGNSGKRAERESQDSGTGRSDRAGGFKNLPTLKGDSPAGRPAARANPGPAGKGARPRRRPPLLDPARRVVPLPRPRTRQLHARGRRGNPNRVGTR